MTTQEAIETLKLMQGQIEWDYPMEYAVAIDGAIDALEKRVAKKVRIGHEYLNKYRHVFYCPNCKHMDVGDVEKWHYCPLCGQALKMEGET